VPSREEWEEAHTAWLAARGLWRDYLVVRSQNRNSLARISCYPSYFRAILQCGDPPTSSAASGLVLAGLGGQALPILTSGGVLSATEKQRLRANLQEEMDRALRELTELPSSPYRTWEGVALHYTKHQLGLRP
jgi:hypothetical protein